MLILFWKLFFPLILCLRLWCICCYLFNVFLFGSVKLNQRDLLAIMSKNKLMSSLGYLQSEYWNSSGEIIGESVSNKYLSPAHFSRLERSLICKELSLEESIGEHAAGRVRGRGKSVSRCQVRQRPLQWCANELRPFLKTADLKCCSRWSPGCLHPVYFGVNKQCIYLKEAIPCLCNYSHAQASWMKVSFNINHVALSQSEDFKHMRELHTETEDLWESTQKYLSISRTDT